jgi:hypothetical protein
MYGGDKMYVQGFGGENEEKRPLGRPRCRWENNIKMDLQKVGWGALTGLMWLRIGTSAFVNAVMNLRVQTCMGLLVQYKQAIQRN